MTTACVLAACAAACPIAAAAQSYPHKPIRLIVPFPPGGPVDAMARVLAPNLSATFKQTVVVDNRPGASGMIGIDAGVRASPDGYTITMVSSSYAASAATAQLSHDPVTDVAPIVLLGVAPQLGVVHPSVPIASAQGADRLRQERIPASSTTALPAPAAACTSRSNTSTSWPERR